MPATRLHNIPDLLALHAANPVRYPHLLESRAVDGVQGRYDILFAFPQARLVLDTDGNLSGGLSSDASTFLAALQEWQQAEQLPSSDLDLPFHGGWFLYLSYELVEEIEPKLKLGKPVDLPIAFAERIPAAIIIDHLDNMAWLVSEENTDDLAATMMADIETGARFSGNRLAVGKITEEPPEQYLSAVQRAIRYIHDGDVFQANLSRRWSAEIGNHTRAADIYVRLRAANPGPFNALATFGESAIVSSSPERLVSLKEGIANTRPIAGTRPRGHDAAADLALIEELISHPKERAEHVMLIDLERNDLGRIAVPGSVEVNEFMVTESYAHVHHIVSNVRARMRPELSSTDLIAATFPGGTITGCPKVRCMEIINELELSPRSAYTGSLGYLNRDGSMDLNILIRTMIHTPGRISFRAGAGIVADSIPENELEETRAKARGLIKALESE